MTQQSLIPASVEALETMIMYLVEAVSKDYNISLETAKPKALELLYESSKKLIGSAPIAKSKSQSNTEFQANLQALKTVTIQIQKSEDIEMIKILANRLQFHLGKLER